MTNVSAETANWRLFGGGGLAVGALLLALSNPLEGEISFWLSVIGTIVIGLGFFFVAWGQTGSNGAVGANLLGKVALGAAATGFILVAIASLVVANGGADGFGLGFNLLQFAWAAIAVGALVAAYVILNKGVAKGLAKYVLFLVGLFALLYAIGLWIPAQALLADWVIWGVTLSVLVTGVLYVLNGKFER